MTKYDKYKDVPHFELIEENKVITIPSLFMSGSNEELYPFLMACKAYNCEVVFENEELRVSPHVDIETQCELFCYTVVMNCRKIGDDYTRYLGKLAQMKWVQGEHEPIL